MSANAETSSDLASEQAALEKLFQLEKDVDRRIAELSIWQLPLKTVLCRLFMTVNSMFGEGNFVRTGPARPEAGAALLSRISYLLPWLRNCSLEGGGHDQALDLSDSRHVSELRAVMLFGHFCELLPEVRRDQYRVACSDNRFTLTRTHESIAAEERDVLLTEISRAHEKSRGPDYRSEMAGALNAWSDLQYSDLRRYLTRSYRHYQGGSAESALLPTDAYRPVFGFSRDELQAVRAGLFAMADVAISVSFAVQSRVSKTSLGEFLFKKGLRWGSPWLPGATLIDELVRLTGLASETVDTVLKPFTLDVVEGDFSNGGDGYLPPLVKFSDGVLFNPHAARAMLPERNLFYVLNRRDRDLFDRTVSAKLEPVLLDQAQQLFRIDPRLMLARNVVWHSGEIDLIVYDPSSNHAFQIQAKAAIPPQGARMTRQIEEHAIRAVEQLRAFMSLDSQAREAICSKAIGRDVRGCSWTSIALSRSGFGTARAWNAFEDIIPTNIQLLKHTLEGIRNSGASLATFAAVSAGSLENLARRITQGWSRHKLDIFGTIFDIPLFDLNDAELRRVKLELIG